MAHYGAYVLDENRQSVKATSMDGAAERRGEGVAKDLLAEAAALHKALKFDDAQRLYEQVLLANPDDYSALSLLGTLHWQRGECEKAVEILRRSLGKKPRQPVALTNLASALCTLKRNEEALDACNRALAFRADYAPAYRNRGDALLELARPKEALECYEKASALKGEDPELLLAQGHALRALKRYLEAVARYDKAIALKPDYAAAFTGRGRAFAALNRFKEAGESYDQAIAIRPDADTYKRGGDLCANNRAVEAALALYDNVIMLRPDDALVYCSRTYVLRQLKRCDEALESCEKAIALDPALPFIRGERMYTRRLMCRWDQLHENTVDLLSAIEAGVNASVPFCFLTVDSPPRLQRRCAELFATKRVIDDAVAAVAPAPRGTLAPGKRLRIAYVSADYSAHPVARQIIGVIEKHDRAEVETIGVSLTRDDGSEIRSRVRAAFDRFVEIPELSDDEAALMLRELNVDIAVDLTGYTIGGRQGIFASRPAPIQVNYLGYPGTSGADYMDYIVADRTLIPDEEQPCYSENIAYLPDTYMPTDNKRTIPSAPDRESLGLPKSGFVFCSMNNSYKFSPEMFDIWMRLLAGIENSVLWLPSTNSAVVRNLDAEAAARGIDPGRLVFAPGVPSSDDHIARLRRADLFLDTLPYNAHSTACEALWAGVPVLTCLGRSFQGRVAASILNAVGLPELITQSLAEYEARALALARSPLELATLKAKLARTRHTRPLFDVSRYTRHLEAAYRRMWEQHVSGNPPTTFTVETLEGDRPKAQAS
jgi:protein O-GlcNAc transferase